MRYLKTLLLIGSFAFPGALLVPKARADEFSQKTTIRFSGSVELPGITLPAGTYVFRLLDPGSGSNFVQVLTEDEQKVLATIQAIPDYRVSPTDKTVINFEERKAGVPAAIKEWFFPDKHFGQEFVYWKTGERSGTMAASMTESAKTLQP